MMFQNFKRATQARTPDLSGATAQQGALDNQAKQRSNALRQQNIGNTMGAAKLYNENVDGSPITDYFRQTSADAVGAESGAQYPMGPETITPDSASTFAEGVNAYSDAAGADVLAAETATAAEAALAAEGGGTAAGVGAGAAGGAAGTTATGAGATAGGGASTALGTAMPSVGAAMALYALLNQ